MTTNDNVVQLHQPAGPTSYVLPLNASGSGDKTCTRCASEFRTRTWHLVWPAESDRAVCPTCALSDPTLRLYQLRSIAADAIDRALTEAPSRDERRLLAQSIVSDVSWFANWRNPDDDVIGWDVLTEQPSGEGDDEDLGSPGLILGAEPVSLRRAALRAGKMLDRHFAGDDILLDALEHAYGNGTDGELAAAVLALVAAAEAVA
ncbi:hypothetical protein [Cellulomonas endometrii]|uniref:hypothetical protein n=1 Tax=Cellulomonas endometrii TaxID=3036301 RepID=UPI0024AC87B6|nr:hypothetical protein [Cellulomonas endometrii]